MTDPTRLLDSKLDAMRRGALEAAIADEPPEGQKAQLWQSIALGLPAAGVLLGATTTTSGVAASTAALGTGSASATTATGVSATAASASLGANAAAVHSGAVGATVAAKLGASAVGASAVGAGAVGASAVGAAASAGMGLIAVKAIAIGVGIGLAANVATGVSKRAFAPQPNIVVPAAMPVPAASAQRALLERRGSVFQEPSVVPKPAAEEGTPTPAVAGQVEHLSATVRGSKEQSDRAAVTVPAPPLPSPREAVTALPRPVESPQGESDEHLDSLTDELREENQLILRARQAQLSSRYNEAIELASEHWRRFPNGRLRQERDAIEVQSLEKLNRIGEARSRAKAFLERYPMSPHAERIRAVAEGVARP